MDLVVFRTRNAPRPAGVAFPIALPHKRFPLHSHNTCEFTDSSLTSSLPFIIHVSLTGIIFLLQFITVSIMIIIAEQYMVPLVRNAIGAFLEVDVISIVERTLKLAVPNLYFWLCGLLVDGSFCS